MPAGVSAYTALANVTLGSSAATVTFSSISQAYRDLVLVIRPFITAPGNSPQVRFNSDTGANYNVLFARGTGTGTASVAYTNLNNTWITFVAVDTAGSNAILNIMDYSATDKHKTMLSRSNAPEYGVDMMASRWASTAAINNVSVYCDGYSFSAGTTMALYGVSA
jgi:hypothetical protein